MLEGSSRHASSVGPWGRRHWRSHQILVLVLVLILIRDSARGQPPRRAARAASVAGNRKATALDHARAQLGVLLLFLFLSALGFAHISMAPETGLKIPSETRLPVASRKLYN